MATKWPEAVPLKNVTAQTVAEALWQIFARTSVPEVILSDQGTDSSQSASFCKSVLWYKVGILYSFIDGKLQFLALCGHCRTYFQGGSYAVA